MIYSQLEYKPTDIKSHTFNVSFSPANRAWPWARQALRKMCLLIRRKRRGKTQMGGEEEEKEENKNKEEANMWTDMQSAHQSPV